MNRTRPLLSAALLVCTAVSRLPAQEPADAAAATRNRVYQEGVEQDQLRLQADRLRQEMTALLEESRQSGGTAADNALIQGAIARLGNLGEKDMATVVQTLRDVGARDVGGAAQGRLVTASNDQRGIQTALKTLADALALRQTREALQGRLQALIARQETNLRHAKELAEANPGAKPVKSLGHEAQAAASLNASEQTAIQNEAGLLAAALDKAASSDAKAPDTANLAAARKLGEEIGLSQQASAATAATGSPDFAKSADSQQAVLTSLQSLAAKMAAGQTAAERLRQGAAHLQELARQQQELAEATGSAGTKDAADIRERQRRIADRAAAVRAEVAAVDAHTADGLNAGEQSLRAVDGLLKNPDAFQNAQGKGKAGDAAKAARAQVANAQAEARCQLDAAGDALTAQADSAAGRTQTPADAARAAAALQAFQQQVGQALAQQQALANGPASPAAADQQRQAAAAAENLQRQTQPLDASAAGTLGQAASQMQQAENSSTPQADAHAAASLLARAQEQLQKDAQAAAAAAASQPAEQALESVIASIKAQTVAAARTMAQTTTGDLTAAVQQTDAAGAAFPQALALAARGGAGGPSPKEVTDNLLAARTDLSSSGLQAAQAQRKPALAYNQRAQTELDAATAAIQRAAAQQLAQALPESAQAQSQNQASEQGQTPSDSSPQGSQSAQAQQGQSSTQSQTGSQSAQAQAASQSQAGQSQASSSQSAAAQSQAGQSQAGQSQTAQSQAGQSQAGQAQASNSAGAGQSSSSGQSQQGGSQRGGQASGSQSGSSSSSGQMAQSGGSGSSQQNERTAGGTNGGFIPSHGTDTGYRVVNGGAAATQREAVALFQNEKVPSEYSEMVQQYSKNLAEGRVPDK